jgi:hypothetical protein
MSSFPYGGMMFFKMYLCMYKKKSMTQCNNVVRYALVLMQEGKLIHWNDFV